MDVIFWPMVMANYDKEPNVAHQLQQLGPEVNWGNPKFNSDTLLHQACSVGNLPLTKALLSHPDIDVNAQNCWGKTPCHQACGSLIIVMIKCLLADARVEVNQTDHKGRTPLWLAGANGNLEVVKCILALRPDVNMSIEAMHPTGEPLGIIDAAKRSWRYEHSEKNKIVELLHEYSAAPLATRLKLLIEMGARKTLTTELFGLTVLLSDGYLQIRTQPSERGQGASSMMTMIMGDEEEETRRSKTRRFFRLTMSLPMELQMLLSHRVFGSAGELVGSRDLEAVLRPLVGKMNTNARYLERQWLS